MKVNKKITCSGSSDSISKHPLIYLTVIHKKITQCPYCMKKFTMIKKNKKTYIESSEVAITLYEK